MDIKHTNTDKNGIFEIFDNDKAIGELTYNKSFDNVIIADHTYVDDEYRSMGIAKKLFDSFIEFVKTNDFKVIALCPYVKRKFDEDDSLSECEYKK